MDYRILTILTSFCLIFPLILALPQQTATQDQSSMVLRQTVVVSTSGTQTWSQTFFPTSFSQYATLTAPTTITTTDTTGVIMLVEVVAGGLAWWTVPKPGVPPIDPPHEPPEPQPVHTDPPHTEEPSPSPTTTSSTTSTTTSSTTSSSLRPGSQVPNTFNLIGNDWTNFWKQTPAKLPDDETQCGFTNDDPAKVQRKTAEEKAKDFCATYKGHKVSVGEPVDAISGINGGLRLNITLQSRSECAHLGDLALDESDCISAFGDVLGSCVDGDSNIEGGTTRDGCFEWILHPQDVNGELNCTDTADGTGLQRDEVLKQIAAYCKEKDGTELNAGDEDKKLYRMNLGDSSAILSIQHVKECPGDPGNNASPYKINERTCTQFFTRTIEECNEKPRDYGKYGGSVFDEFNCARFDLQTEVAETIICPEDKESPDQPVHTINWKDAGPAIDYYCDQNLQLDPDFQLTNFCQEPKDCPGRSDTNFVHGLDHYRIHMGVVSLKNDGCDNKKWNTGGKECKRKMHRIFDTCQRIQGVGTGVGAMQDWTADGCLEWYMYASNT